jgi:CheY-like chemotaxis protein
MRSPINGIIGMCRCLLDGELSKDQALFAHCISESTNSLLRTMNDIHGISNVGLDSMAIQSPPFPAHPPTKQEYITIGRWAGSTSNHPSHESAIPRTLAPPPQLDVHVLLVENNLVMRKIMTKMSEKFSHRMTIVDSGQDALTYLARTSGHPRPKVVLLNCKMQVAPLDGYETTRRIRNDYAMFDEETRNLPIIGLTIIGHNDGVEKCLSAGMDDCMTKPVMQKKFKDVLVKWMVARRSYKLGHVVDAKL